MINRDSYTAKDLLLNVRTAALELSDALHAAEVDAWEIPDYVDRAWLRLSQAIEASTPQLLDAAPKVQPDATGER